MIEVSHGSGLNGSTIQQGFSIHSEFDLIAAAVETAKQEKLLRCLYRALERVKN